MHDKPASLKLIQWICFARRPLSLDELRWAMVVDINSPQKLQECENDVAYTHDNDAMERKLKRLSCGLAETVLSSNKWVVQFIHQSVNDYFAEKGLKGLSDDTAEGDCAVGNAHYRLSRTCLRYLAIEEIAQSTITDRDTLTSKFPLLHYATTSWISHAYQSQARKGSQDDLLDYFPRSLNALLQVWVRVYQKLQRYSRHCPPEKTTMAHVLSRYRLIAPLRVLLQRANQVGIDINSEDGNGQTPLSYAAADGCEAVVQLLLEKGADTETKDRFPGRTPLSQAVEGGHEAVVRLLLEKGADTETKDRFSGRTPLSQAVEGGHEAVVRLLLEKGANTETMDITFQTPLSRAAANGHKAIARLLLKNGANTETENMVGQTPLSLAAAEGHEAVVRLLLEKGADTETKASTGRTPLWYATANGHDAVVRFLLEKGADIETKDRYSRQTPLSRAAKGGHEAVVRLLLENGANTETEDITGLTPLLWAAAGGHEAVVQLLRRGGP